MKADITVHIPPGWRRLKPGTFLKADDRFLCQDWDTSIEDECRWEIFGGEVEENEDIVDTVLPADFVIRKRVAAKGRRS